MSWPEKLRENSGQQVKRVKLKKTTIEQDLVVFLMNNSLVQKFSKERPVKRKIAELAFERCVTRLIKFWEI